MSSPSSTSPRHASNPRRSLLMRVALSFAAAVILTAMALTLSAYFITKTAQDKDALDKALAQSRFNLVLADSMLPATPEDSDYKQLVKAFQIRGDFATLIETGQQPYTSGFDVSADLVTPELAARVAEGHIGYQMITISGQPTLVVGGPAHSGGISLYFFYPQADRLAQLAQLRNILIIGGVVLAVLGALVGYLLARGLVLPVRRASKAAVQMSQGDLGIRLPTGPDEFGVLATSFNRMAENLQTKMLDLEAGQARERRFVADVTHELRTPVAALVGEASLLKTRLDTEPGAYPSDVARLVNMVSADITRLRQLVDDLLEISRLEAQAAETVIEPVAVGSFLEQLVRAHGWSEQVGLSGAGEVPGGAAAISQPDIVVLADRRRMERIVVNLVENALRHGAAPVTLDTSRLLNNDASQSGHDRCAREKDAGSANSGAICACRECATEDVLSRQPACLGSRMSPDGEGFVVQQPPETATGHQGELLVRIAVTDNGPGIPPEHLPHIFDRFYKADPSRASSRGSGLGLAIARENARLLGGEVTAANVPERGARFVLTLPAAED